MICKGDVVKIKPQWQDPGDDEFKWIAIEGDDGGRVRIATLIPGFSFHLEQVVNLDMLVCAS